MEPGRKRRSRVALAAASLLLCLLLVEGAVRLRQYARFGTAVFTYYHLVEDPASGLRVPRPNDVVGPVRVNSLGFRGDEIEVPKPPGRIRVAFLGGSTTFCAEASSLEATWPHLVVQGLREAAPDLEFDYVNGGGAGYGTEQSLLNLEKRVAPLEPDVIVFYEATNDLVQDSRREAIERGLFELEEGRDSAIGEWWMTYFLAEKNLRSLLRTRANDRPKLEVEPAQLSAPFRERLTRLVEEAREVAPVVALLTFSTKMRAGQPPEVQRANAASALYYMPFLSLEGVLAGYAEYNRVIREVAGASGCLLIEGELSIPGDGGHFSDSVHLVDPGLRLQARRVLDVLPSSPAYQALLVSRRAGRKAVGSTGEDG